jgi:hypothetical protein
MGPGTEQRRVERQTRSVPRDDGMAVGTNAGSSAFAGEPIAQRSDSACTFSALAAQAGTAARARTAP